MNMPQVTISSQPRKRERLEIRVNQDLKALLQRAADIQGRSLSDFLATTAENAASQIIHDSLVIQFSAEDSIAFANALFNAPKPNTKLRSAYSIYKKEVSSQ